jgi:hypothetical protein
MEKVIFKSDNVVYESGTESQLRSLPDETRRVANRIIEKAASNPQWVREAFTAVPKHDYKIYVGGFRRYYRIALKLNGKNLSILSVGRQLPRKRKQIISGHERT